MAVVLIVAMLFDARYLGAGRGCKDAGFSGGVAAGRAQHLVGRGPRRKGGVSIARRRAPAAAAPSSSEADCDSRGRCNESASPSAAAAALLQWNVVVTSVGAHCATAVGRARVEQWIDVDSALAKTQQDAERRLAQTAAAAQLSRLPAGEGGMMLGEGDSRKW